MKDLLKQYFGYEQFRPLQEEIINHVVQRNDCFVLMPTGGGKSLCYQLPALKFSGLTLVISPLISLMKDQVDALRACGIKAEFINSSLSPKQITRICDQLKDNQVKILYIAPERFALNDFRNFLKGLPVSLIAVDEAHCISEWGHDFRPDYRNLSLIKELFPETPLIALTATATQKVREDIINQLRLQKARVFISSFNRANLRVSVVEKKQAFPKLVGLLRKYRNESAIIYCFSRNDTETIAADLRANRFKARAYHAGLKASDRAAAQDLFIKDEVDIIVATIAFGMGIDKPDVRLVVHYTYPKTLEGYYQEIGRAGRDGLPSECVMFYTYADTRKHEFFINQIEDYSLQRRAREKLNEVTNFANLITCRKKYLLKYFGEELGGDNCGGCDICESWHNDPEPAGFEPEPASRIEDYNKELFEELRVLRKHLADREHVPPFIIFGDTALAEMAHYLPPDEESFGRINGVGAKKLEQFAAIFLAVINDFAQKHNLTPKDIPEKKRHNLLDF
ncbi:MAG: ATP-dependent DNA helicase [Candidatus Pacebacteria bacterium]|nr:ATP-dependent DNA helicase [Candidatus Paceibacterota bacterium]